MSDTRNFYAALCEVTDNEFIRDEAKSKLEKAYPVLVESCPHIEAIEYNFNIHGSAPVRICKTCGVEDHGIIGQTSGDEYNYGFAGRHDHEFWKDTKIEVTSDRHKFFGFRKQHGFRVVSGKVQQ